MTAKPQIFVDPGYDPASDPLAALSGGSASAAPAADAGPPPMPKISMGSGAPAPVFAPGPAPQVSRMLSPIEQEEGVDNQKLQDLHKHDSYDFSQHSKLRNVGHVLSKIGNVAGDIFAPATMANISGTDLNRQVQEGSLSSRLQALAAEQSENEARDAGTAETKQKTAGLPQDQADTSTLKKAQAANLDSEVDARAHPKQSWKPLTGYAGKNGEPLEMDETTGLTRPAPGADGAKPSKETNPQQQTYDDLLKQGLTPMQAYEKIRAKPPGISNAGTWAIDEDKAGNPVMFNSKTGETKVAPGIQKAGTKAKADAAIQPVQAALDYANDYVPRTAHTGSGDEALMEKFFELAKPSTGFRMSQPQIDMLKNAQSWMGGIEAHIRHAAVGTWFSDDQRKEILNTMTDLGKAKGLSPKGDAGAAGGGAAEPQRPEHVPANFKFDANGPKGPGWYKP
jgi:hypothetical protein